jgi:hypothetical protein
MGLPEWRAFVKKWAPEHNTTYICAISNKQCQDEYHAKYGTLSMPKREPAMRTATTQHATLSSIKSKPFSTRTHEGQEMLMMMPRRNPATRTATPQYATLSAMKEHPYTEAKKKFKVGQRIPMTPEAKRALAENAQRKKAEALLKAAMKKKKPK